MDGVEFEIVQFGGFLNDVRDPEYLGHGANNLLVEGITSTR